MTCLVWVDLEVQVVLVVMVMVVPTICRVASTSMVLEAKEAVISGAGILLMAVGLHPMVAATCLVLLDLEVQVVLAVMVTVVPTGTSLPWLPAARATTTIRLVGPMVVPTGTSRVLVLLKEAVIAGSHILLKAVLHHMVAATCLVLVDLEVQVILVVMVTVVPIIRRVASMNLQVQLVVDPGT